MTESHERADPDKLLTVEDLCARWGVKQAWVYDEVEKKRLKATRLGRQLRFQLSCIDAYIAEHTD